MYVDGIDHFVLTVKDIDTTCAFYERVLGMKTAIFGENRKALTFGTQKINLHQRGKEFEPKAKNPIPGAADFCLITSIPISDVVAHLSSCGVRVLEGPVQKIGARGPMVSVYFRDPDQNLIEVSNYARQTSEKSSRPLKRSASKTSPPPTAPGPRRAVCSRSNTAQASSKAGSAR